MAKKKENLKEVDGAALNKKLVELEEQIRVLKFKEQGSRSKNVKESSSLKKEVARILTILNSKK